MDTNFFEKIDTEQKAYFLGFMCADGYNCNKKTSKYIRITLHKQDRHILEDFQSCIGSSYLLRESRDKYISLQINGSKISDDLVKLGCVRAKTLILKFPTKEQVPSKLLNHYIRGYFDGDGCVWGGERKVMYFKSRPQGRVVHNVKFNITSTPEVILGIQDELVTKLGFSRNRVNTSKGIGQCVQLEYSGRGSLRKFHDYIYQNSTVFLKRKKEKFDDILSCANMG